MWRDFNKTGKLQKRYIIHIDEINNKIINLDKYVENIPIKTDFTPVVQNRNLGYPRVKYNF